MPSPTVIGPNGTVLAVVDEDTKVDIRRYCGYPAYGYGTTGFYEMGAFLPSFLNLELRMNSLTVSEYTRVAEYFLPTLAQLEDDLFGMRTAMIVEKAAVFTRNANEASDRHAEFAWWRMHLVNFLGLRPGPALDEGGGSSFNVVRTVV